MFFSIDLFIDALILLIHIDDPNMRFFIGQILDAYERETKRDKVSNSEYYDLYIFLIRDAIERNLTIRNTTEMDALLLRLKSNPLVIKDPELYSTLRSIFTNTDELKPDQIKTYMRELANAVMWDYDTVLVKRMFSKLLNNATLKDPDQQDVILNDLVAMCSEIIQHNQETQNRLEEKSDDTRITYLDTTDRDSLVQALKVYNNTAVTNTFKTGLNALNRALGGGFKLGSSIVFNSRSHNGKSMMLMKMVRWQVTLNRVSEQFPNPTCILYSLENETPQNLLQLFTEMYENKYKTIPPKDISQEEIVDFCFDEFKRYGWKLIIDRRLGADFGFPELVANFNEYLSLGYTPLMCVIDYMNMMRKSKDISDSGSTNALMVRTLYTNVCNFLKMHNCTLVTAHQLNRKADEAVRLNPLGAVKKFGPDMLSDSIDVQREVDISIYMNKESDAQGHPFMTYNVNKVRYYNDLPDRDRYFAYAFHGPLGILDDINDIDRSTDNIYAYDYAKEDARLFPDGRPESESDKAYRANHPTRADGELAVGAVDIT